MIRPKAFLAMPIVFAAAVAAAPASAACTAAQMTENTQVFPALDAWQGRSGTALAPAFRREIAQSFCVSATSLAKAGRTRAEIDLVTAPAVSAYLDAYAADGPAQSVDAALRTQLGASGMARPIFRSYGLLRIVMAHQVDSFRVGTAVLPPVPRAFVPVGTSTFVGSKDGIRRCAGIVTVVAGTTATARC